MLRQEEKIGCMRFVSILIISALIFMGFASVVIISFENIDGTYSDSSENIARESLEYRGRSQINAPWPMFRQNIQHTGLSQYSTNNNDGYLKWKYETGNDIESSPVIGPDGTIYISSHDNHLYAFTYDGNLKWKYDTTVMTRSSPAIGPNGTIYISSGSVFALNPDGTLKWKYHTGVPSKTGLTIGPDNTIYVVAGDYIYAIYPNGTLKWMVGPNHSFFSSPAIDSNGTIYFGSSDYFNALYPNGSFKWRYTIKDDKGCSSPTIDSNGIIYYNAIGYLYAFYTNGTLKWKFYTGSDAWVQSSPAIDANGIIYFGAGLLYALYPNGTNKWNTSLGVTISSPALGSDGTIFIGSDNGKIYSVYPNGIIKWNYQTEDWVRSSPAIGKDGTIFIGSDDWYIYSIGNQSNSYNNTPIANAGLDQNITIDQSVHFNGNKSNDPDNDPLIYHWSFGDGKQSGWQYSSNISHSYDMLGKYLVTLIVSDGLLSDNDTCIVNVINQPPVADAGSDQNATIDQTIYFDGSGSYDLDDNDTLTYKWDFGDGTSSGWQSDCNSSHAYSNKGYYTVYLTVSDADLIDVDSCIIHIVNQPPIADAGPDQNVTVDEIVNFDASDSYDPDNDPLKYFWFYGDGKFSDHDNDGIPDYYENESAPVKISHSYSASGNYTVTLIVSDGFLEVNDTCIISVSISGGNNSAPIADAGPDQNLTVNQTGFFDGSASYDPDNDPLTYNWDFGDGSSTGWQSNCNSSHSYDTPGNYTVTLYINDSEFTDSDICIVHVSGSWVGNHPPSITIIEPDGVDDYAGDTFIITWYDFDPDDNAMIGLYYDTDNSGFDGTLIVEDINENNASNYYVWKTFKIPAGSYFIYAQIYDGNNDPGYDYSNGAVTVKHSLPNQPPIANAGSDQSVKIGQTVTFDANSSYDPDGDALLYKWTFSDDTSTGWQNDWITSHFYDIPGNYFVTLTVSDGLLTDEDICIIYVAGITGNYAPVADAGLDQTVKVNQIVLFDGSGSYDPDGDELFYLWDFGDLSIQSWVSSSNISHVYAQPGNYTATLFVKDSEFTVHDNCTIYALMDGGKPPDGNDTDGDGLPDDWELEHGLDPDNPDDALLDADGDTLTNLAEFEYGTDPNDKDTDSDGISDGWEIEYGLAPTDAKDALSDFDGDSLSNLKEFELGTNPNDKDTDGDGYTDYIDDYPTNADKYKKQVADDNTILETLTIIFIVIIIAIILILMTAVIYKNKRKMGGQDIESDKQFEGRHEVGDDSTAQELQPPEDLELKSDKIIDDLKKEALSPRKPSSLDLSNEEMLTQFEEKRRDGKISDGTYNLIQDKLDRNSQRK